MKILSFSSKIDDFWRNILTFLFLLYHVATFLWNIETNLIRSVIMPSVLAFQEETESLLQSRTELEHQLASANSTVAILQTEKSKLQTEVQESKKEQDDLLMLLADQDQKIHNLRQRLKDLGEMVHTASVFKLLFKFTRQFRRRRYEFNSPSWHSRLFIKFIWVFSRTGCL